MLNFKLCGQKPVFYIFVFTIKGFLPMGRSSECLLWFLSLRQPLVCQDLCISFLPQENNLF